MSNLTKEEGIELSAKASGQDWAEYALKFLYWYLWYNKTMHVDDLWTAGLVTPVSPRALGAVVKQAATNGWMRMNKTEEGYIIGKPSKSSHDTIKAVWLSNLYRPDPEQTQPDRP
jgi:hypothetical protein